MKMRFHHRRIMAFFFMVLGCFLLLAARLYQIQVIQSGLWTDIGEKTKIRAVPLTGKRGTIFSAGGDPLAITVPAYSLAADPTKLKDPARVASLLAPILKMPVRVLERKLTPRWLPPAGPTLGATTGPPPPPGDEAPRAALSTRFIPGTLRPPPTGTKPRRPAVRSLRFIWIQRLLEEEAYEAVRALIEKDKELGMKQGLILDKEFKRIYPQGEMLAQVLGFCGVDNTGLEGLEHRLNDVLGGVPGERIVLISPTGKEMPRSISLRRPKGYNDVYLTIDREIQYYVEKELDRVVDRYQPKTAFAIVMDPNTGQIQAMANRPTFDPNLWASSNRRVWRNNSVSDVIEPGSVFKLVTAAAALEDGRVEPRTPLECDGKIILWDHPIRCMGVHGRLELEAAIERSCNVGLIRVGQVMGPRNFYYYMRKFGFGQKTGINVPGEQDGLLRPPEQWSGLSIGALSIGQEIAVTGIQMIGAVAAIVNGGQYVMPRIIDRIVNPETGEIIRQTHSEFKHRVISETTAEQLRRMMRLVVRSGTGTEAALEDYPVAGKTGTSQKLGTGKNELGRDRYVASFVGYLPADVPRSVIYIVLNEPNADKVSGGTMATPVFREIARRVMLLQHVQPRAGSGDPVRSPDPPLAPVEPALAGSTPAAGPEGPEPAALTGDDDIDRFLDDYATPGVLDPTELGRPMVGEAPGAPGDTVSEYLDGYLTGGEVPQDTGYWSESGDEVDEALLYRYEDE